MRKIVLKRAWKMKDYTVGKLYVDSEYWCNTMEDKDRGLTDKMSESEIKAKKVYGQTAIPTGVYMISLAHSPKFATREWGKKYGGLVPELQDVKGFSGVRIHPLNTAADSLGCIGPGINSVKGQVKNSTVWYYKLMDKVFIPAHESGEPVRIEIY